MLPEYLCHKRVRAARIVSIVRNRSCPSVLHLEGGHERPVLAGWMAKHNPHVGGYYVEYADAYTSFSPAAAFEDGYTLQLADAFGPLANKVDVGRARSAGYSPATAPARSRTRSIGCLPWFGPDGIGKPIVFDRINFGLIPVIAERRAGPATRRHDAAGDPSINRRRGYRREADHWKVKP